MLIPLFDMAEGAEPTLGTYIFVAIISFFLSLPYFCSVIMYILQALGLYRIAKRRGIYHSWLAWIPCGRYWLLGSISDHYQLVVRGKQRYCRVFLLLLSILVALAGFLVLVFTWALPLQFMNIVYSESMRAFLHMPLIKNNLLPITKGLIVCLLALRLFPLYRLYQSAFPRRRILLLILSILVPFSPAIIIFAIQKHDKGMPPRQYADSGEFSPYPGEQNQKP